MVSHKPVDHCCSKISRKCARDAFPCLPEDNRRGCFPNIGNSFPVVVFSKDIAGLASSRAMRNSNRGVITAQRDRQETGRHPHKSTEESDPHTKDNEGEGEHRSRSSHSSHATTSRVGLRVVSSIAKRHAPSITDRRTPT